MDSPSFYTSPTQVAAKNFEMIQRRQELQAHLARLQNELDAHAKSWIELGKNVSDCSDINSLTVSDNKLTITRRSNGWQVDAPSRHFDLGAIKKLSIEMNETKGELARIKSQVDALGLGI